MERMSLTPLRINPLMIVEMFGLAWLFMHANGRSLLVYIISLLVYLEPEPPQVRGTQGPSPAQRSE